MAPNIITSPQQRGLLSLRRPEEEERGTIPGSVALSLAALRGLARVAGEGAAAREAEEAVKRKPLEITSKVDPQTGDTLLTMKNFSAKLLEGTDEERSQAAYDRPQEEVIATLRGLGYDVADPTGADIAAKSRTPEGVRALNREANTRLGAWLRERFGRATPRNVEENVREHRRAQLDSAYRSAAPLVAEVNRIETRNRLERGEAAALERVNREAFAAALKETDGSAFENYDEFIRQVETVAGPLGPGEAARAQQKFTQDHRKADAVYFKDFRDKTDLGSFDSMPEVAQAYGARWSALPRERQAQIEAEWQAKYRKRIADETVQQRRLANEARAAAREDRAVATAERAARNEERKLTNEEKKERTKAVDAILSEIDSNNKEIVKIAREIVKPDLEPEERRFLQERRKELVARTNELADRELPQHGVILKSRQTERFSPQIEAGIAAYMQSKGYGLGDRVRAIAELRAAGRIK